MTARRLTENALLTAVALILFTVEAQIPLPVPIPGVKLGLANIVTVWAVCMLGPADALCILLCRIFLGAVFAGNMSVLLYSLSGGLFSLCVLLLLRRVTTRNQLWICAVFAAIAHNAGQIIAAVLILQSLAVLAYFPFLAVSGAAAGLFTGLCAQ
ncbi:MAG: Gx transporter family protein, partial [Oscillospiraceae bacterium]|nr:Gx transporter family protein [Oscillospiraceae bacterium]